MKEFAILFTQNVFHSLNIYILIHLFKNSYTHSLIHQYLHPTIPKCLHPYLHISISWSIYLSSPISTPTSICILVHLFKYFYVHPSYINVSIIYLFQNAYIPRYIHLHTSISWSFYSSSLDHFHPYLIQFSYIHFFVPQCLHPSIPICLHPSIHIYDPS